MSADHAREAALEEAPGDDQALDLAGALPDAVDPQLAQEALGDVLAHVAAAAEDLDAAVGELLAKGFEATRIDEVCAKASVAKGGFFHHFKSKEDLAIAAAAHFAGRAEAMFAAAAYHGENTARDRLLAYIDLRKAMMKGELADFTCLFGMMAQETYTTHPRISGACGSHIAAHAQTLAGDVADALEGRGPPADCHSESLALFMQAVVQGAFVLSKAQADSRIATDCLDHLKRYIELLMPAKGGKK